MIAATDGSGRSPVTTAGDSAYAKVRDDIIFGVLQPGSRLRLEALRTQYGPSVPTMREVLSRLTSEGFVDAEGQKGFAVAPVSVTGLREVAAMRRLIEADALRSSFASGDLDWEVRVIAAHHRLSRIEAELLGDKSPDIRTWKQYDKDFHVALISNCSSAFALAVYDGVYSHYLRYQMMALGFRGEPARMEHQRLLDLALARDAEAAVCVLGEHIDKGVEHAVANWPSALKVQRRKQAQA